MFGSWVLNKICIIGLSSALVEMLLSSSKLFPLSKEVIVIGTALCYGHQVCCLLYYLDKINSGIHMYQFTLKPLQFCFRMCLWFRIWTKILADLRIWRKKGSDRRICIPLFTPLREREIAKNSPRGRITKIVDCIRIVFGLPYNYKPNLSVRMI